jgi:DNA-binding MarR family transcriptional regulator
MPTSEDLVEEIIDNYRVVARGLDRIMLPRLIELGLSMPQFKALIAVCSAGPGGISVTQLGNELSIGQPSASLIVDQLSRVGYVVRVPDRTDRRRVLVTSTPVGLEVTAELRHGRRTTLRKWLSRIDEVDAEALLKGLKAFAIAVETSSAGEVPVH